MIDIKYIKENPEEVIARYAVKGKDAREDIEKILELDAKQEPEKLRETYPEFLPHEGCCRFSPCLHDREPGCAVTAAMQAGQIAPCRVERYRQLLADVRETWKQRYN